MKMAVNESKSQFVKQEQKGTGKVIKKDISGTNLDS